MRKFLLFNTNSPRIRNFQFIVALLVTALLVSSPVTYGQVNSAAAGTGRDGHNSASMKMGEEKSHGVTEEFEITELSYSTNFTAELGWRLEPSSGDLLISKVNATNRYGTANDPTYKFDFYYRSNGTRQIIAGPEMDLRGYTNPRLKFDVSHCVYVQFSPSNDRLEVVYTTDNGTTWLTGSPALYNKAGSVLATRALDYNPFTPSLASEWRRETVDLSQLAGMSGIRLGFRV